MVDATTVRVIVRSMQMSQVLESFSSEGVDIIYSEIRGSLATKLPRHLDN